MEKLKKMSCEACRRGAPTVTEDEAEAFLREIPDWAIEKHDDVDRLVRVFTFPDFSAALAFTNRVGAIADEEQHHPALLTEWGRVTVQWWTHKIGGLHRNDFIMAAKTDAIAESSE